MIVTTGKTSLLLICLVGWICAALGREQPSICCFDGTSDEAYVLEKYFSKVVQDACLLFVEGEAKYEAYHGVMKFSTKDGNSTCFNSKQIYIKASYDVKEQFVCDRNYTWIPAGIPSKVFPIVSVNIVSKRNPGATGLLDVVN